MAETSKIEWTDATWNPVTGCDKVGPGCDNRLENLEVHTRGFHNAHHNKDRLRDENGRFIPTKKRGPFECY